MKRSSILSLAGTIVFAGTILTGRLFGQAEDTDANGVPMKLYPKGYKETTQTKPVKKTALSGANQASPMLLDTDPPLIPGDKANMVWIYPGTFMMGDVNNDFSGNGKPVHQVTITGGFYIGKYLVTQSEYQTVMGSNPSWFQSANGFTDDLNRPVESVSWINAQNYCAQLTAQELAAGHIQNGWAYRLPTEAEWEYSYRAGTTTQFYYGSDPTYQNLPNYAWFNVNSSGITHTVGQKLPNAWGLYDMAGNIWEWTQDWNGDYSANPVIDPKGPLSGAAHVFRGGYWNYFGIACSAFIRGVGVPDNQGDNSVGFRIVLASTTGIKDAVATTPPQKVYGNYPVRGMGKNNLVIITHGWNSLIANPPVINPPDLTWINTMSNAVQTYFDNHGMNDWQVYGYRWLNNSWTIAAPDALYNARGEGVNLGSAVGVQGWSHVHLISHSAGAELISEASQWIKTGGATVHCTFLDPYVGNDKAGVANYGSGCDWSDQYFSHDVTGDVTEQSLVNAYNVDVTQLGPKQGIGKFRSQATGQMEACTKTIKYHGWPIDFYMNTITGNNVDSDYAGFGFLLSKEAGGWASGVPNYTRGNGTPGHAELVRRLGAADPTCVNDIHIDPPIWSSLVPDFGSLPSFQSETGSNQKWNSSLKLVPGSPSWVATVITATNPLNTVSFDAQFSGVSGSEDMLSVLWDVDTIGTVDERVVQPGLQHYSLRFNNAIANSTHVLSFRLDPFTSSKSSMTITNVVLTQIGPSQPFTLSVTTNTVGGLLVWQLSGEAGFAYGVQASTNLASTNWTDIAELVNTNGTVQFYDQDSTNYPMRFYRAVGPNQ